MTGLLTSGGIAGSGLAMAGATALADSVLSALGGITIGSAARLLTGLADGQAVDAFTNTASSGITLTNTGANRPIYNSSGINLLNSLPTLTFDGADDRFIVSALPFATGNSSFSAYAVFRAGSSSATRNVFRIGGASTRRGIGLNIPSGGSSLVRFEVTGDVLDVTTTGTTNQVWLIAAMRYNNSNNTVTGDVYGSRTGSGSRVLAGAPNWDTAMAYNSIGQGATGVAMLSGQLAELWFYDQHHSDVNRDAAVNRLKSLYGI